MQTAHKTSIRHLFSLTSEKLRKVFLVFYVLSVLLPVLILIFILLQHVYPSLSTEQVKLLTETYTFGLTAILLIPFLSFFFIFSWIKLVEKVTGEAKSKFGDLFSLEDSQFKEENEMLILQSMFDRLHKELQEKMVELNSCSHKLITSNIQVSKLAITDDLTTLYNRRHFRARLIEETSRAERYNHDLAIIMVDLDGFKAYNDTYGHLAGDKVLRELGILIRSSVRKSDTSFRYGGDEFAILCPECDLERAKLIAQKLVDLVENHSFDAEGDAEGDAVPLEKVTVSCGVARYHQDLETFVHEADKCLLEAKKASGGSVVCGSG